jgi:hypothetical protein
MKGNKYEQTAYLIWFYCIVAFVVVSAIELIVRFW